MISDVRGVLDDYFARRPPFSTKKKYEFPDAVSIASVRLWCEQNRSTAYIVSEDPDLRACCSETGPLFHAGSITEIISQATVSQVLHEALEKALSRSEHLRDELVEQIEKLGVDIERSSSHDCEVLAGEIDGVRRVNIISVNVLDQEGQTFRCELEVEADVAIKVDVEFRSRYGMDYEPESHHSMRRTKVAYFYPEVVVRFNHSTGDLEFESIYVPRNGVEVDVDDVLG